MTTPDVVHVPMWQLVGLGALGMFFLTQMIGMLRERWRGTHGGASTVEADTCHELRELCTTNNSVSFDRLENVVKENRKETKDDLTAFRAENRESHQQIRECVASSIGEIKTVVNEFISSM